MKRWRTCTGEAGDAVDLIAERLFGLVTYNLAGLYVAVLRGGGGGGDEEQPKVEEEEIEERKEGRE